MGIITEIFISILYLLFTNPFFARSTQKTFHSTVQNIFLGIVYTRQVPDECKLESTPDNVYEEAAPGRIYKYNPKAKLIFLVREPVSRAISEYNMACKYAIVKNLCVREDPEREYFEDHS